MFSDFFDFFEQKKNIFNRPVKDMKPYEIFKAKSGLILTVNTLGISQKDLSIQLSKPKGMSQNYSLLTIKGATNIEKINYENNVDLQILLKFDRKVEDISYECRDGLTLIYLKIEPEINEVEEPMIAKIIDNGDDFDF